MVASKKLLLDVLAWMKTVRAEVNSGEATLTGRTQHAGQNLLERVWRAAEADGWPAPETGDGRSAEYDCALEAHARALHPGVPVMPSEKAGVGEVTTDV